MQGEKRKAEEEADHVPGTKRVRSTEHTEGRSYNIFVGSWNVNQKNPKKVDWKKWLSPPLPTGQVPVNKGEVNAGMSEDEGEKVHAGMEVTEVKHDEVDIYVISFQEDPPPPEIERFDNWNTEFMNYIDACRVTPLVPVFSSSLGGTGLFIFSTPEVKAEISEEDSNLVEVGRSKTTIKGAVCYRCTLNCFPPLSLSFAGVHFTADQEQENVEARIRDYHTINNSVFPNQKKRFLVDHTFSCLVGDVNFRINLPRDIIAQHVNEENYDALFDHDQLNIAKREGKAFVEYSEGKISFPPTYKYIIGTDQFDLVEPPGKRSPAYTDRIFFQHHNLEPNTDNADTPHIQSDAKVELHHYTLGRLVESDHKPVSCYISLHVGAHKNYREKRARVEVTDMKQEQKQPDNDKKQTQQQDNTQKKETQQGGSILEGDTSKVLLFVALVAFVVGYAVTNRGYNF